ncbi:putative pentatricopeptide repeat-containing protein, partial [Cucurbita argyrosperma subsp. sororia]
MTWKFNTLFAISDGPGERNLKEASFLPPASQLTSSNLQVEDPSLYSLTSFSHSDTSLSAQEQSLGCMAFGASRRYLSYPFKGCLLGRLTSGRYHYPLPYLPSLSSALSYLFSTLDEPSNLFDDVSVLGNGIRYQRSIDERFVMRELSDLLLVNPYGSVSDTVKENHTEKQVSIRAVDGFLRPEEKLRGVFLQKLNGKTAIEHALANTDVNLSQDVVNKVLNTGSLGSEAMITFFDWAIKQPSIPTDTSSYNIILKALGRRRFFDSMMDVLHNMTRKGVVVNMETVSIVVDSLVKARQVSKALQLFKNLKEYGLKCDTETLNILLQCMCRRSHVGAASSFFNLIKGSVPFNAMAYNILISGWSRYGRLSEVERILKAMEADGFSPDCLTYTYLLECLGRANRIDDAVKIFDEMVAKGCTPDVGSYNAMISNFICIGDFDECLTYYNRMLSNKCEPDINTYSNLIIAFLKAKKVADALEMFDEMVGSLKMLYLSWGNVYVRVSYQVGKYVVMSITNKFFLLVFGHLKGPSFDAYLWALAIHLVSNALISGNMSDHFGHSFSHVVPTPRVLLQVLHHNAKD